MAITIAIIGLDRLGASMALALKQSELEAEVIGYDRDERVSKEAQAAGIIDRSRWGLVGTAAAADVIVLSLPVTELELVLERIGRDVKPHALLLDMSRVKAPAQRWADQHLKQGHFVGIAPVLSASAVTAPDRGIESASADLFQNSLMCVIPSTKAEPKAVESAVNLGTRIGAKPFFLDLMEYDALATAVDVLPGLLAAAMFGAVNQSASWRDILKFAGNDFALSSLPLQQEANIAHMAVESKASTVMWLNSVMEQLRLLVRHVQEGEVDVLASYFTELGIERDRWLDARQKNSWEEIPKPEWETVGVMNLLVGRRRPKDDTAS